MGERFRCGRRNQHEGESVALFVAELRRLSLHCGYADNLTTALSDQFVLGLRSESTQKKLVKVKNLSLETAIETAKIDETAGRDTNELQHRHGEASASVHKLHSQQQPRQNRERETENREEITYATDVKAAGTGRTIVASETKSATDVGSLATSGPCVSSNGSDDNEWSDGLHTLDAVHQLTKPKNRHDLDDTAGSRATA